jgi:hypothetical protein
VFRLKNILAIVLGVLVAGFIASIAIGVLTVKIPDPQVLRDTYDSVSKGEEDAYMQGCLEGNTVSSAYCQCTFDYLDDSLTNIEIRDLFIRAVDNPNDSLVVKKANNAYLACGDRL